MDPDPNDLMCPDGSLNLPAFAAYIAPKLPKVLSDFVGCDVRALIDRRVSAEAIEAEITRIKPFFDELLRLGTSPPSRETMLGVFDAIDSLLRAKLPEIPDDIHFFDWSRETLKRWTRGPTPLEFRRTKFQRYRRQVDGLVSQLAEQGRLFAAHEHLDTIGATLGALVMQPLLRLGTQDAFMQLLRRERSVSYADLDLLVNSYRQLAGLYERLLLIPLHLCALLDGRDREPFDRASLYQRIERLRSDPRVSVLARGLNRTIRNAIAHDRIQELPSEKKLRLTDANSELTLSPRGLLTHTRETAAAVYAMFETWNHLQYQEYVVICRARTRLLAS